MKKELRKFSRRELVDIIYQMKKNEQKMQEEIDALQKELQDKRLKLSSAGSIAEVAAELTQIFAAAQTTADIYLQEIACMKEETEREYKMMKLLREEVRVPEQKKMDGACEE